MSCCSENKPRPYSLPWEKPDGELHTCNLLFRWTDDLHIRARGFDLTVWKRAFVAAGVIPPPEKDKNGRRQRYARGGGMHQLRHYYASVTLTDGVSIRDLAEFLGHADPGFTLRVYAHFMPSSHEKARKAIDGRMFKPRPVLTSNSDGPATDQDGNPAR